MSNQVIGNATLTNTTLTDLIPAQGAGTHIYLTHILVTNAHATQGTLVTIKDDTEGGTNILAQGYAAAAGGGFALVVTNPIAANENRKVQVQCGSSATVYVSVGGFKEV